MTHATGSGHLDVVRWLHENRTEGCSTDVMNHITSLRTLQWLHEHRSEGCTGAAMNDAACTWD